MKKQSEAEELRRAAEARLKAGVKVAKSTDADQTLLVHELQVHQIELEMQNEELREVRAELETTLARYTELYEFAPVGYLTLDRHGIILQLNLAAGHLLGVERGNLLGQHFDRFIGAEQTRQIHTTVSQRLERRQTKDV